MEAQGRRQSLRRDHEHKGGRRASMTRMSVSFKKIESLETENLGFWGGRSSEYPCMLFADLLSLFNHEAECFF